MLDCTNKNGIKQALRLTLKIMAVFFGAVLLSIAAAFIYLTCFYKEPVYIVDHSSRRGDVTIQPAEAIAIAAPYVPAHGTFVYRKDRPLTLHLMKHGDWYYVMRTNYPAKTTRYYLQPAVRVHVHTGAIDFTTR